MARADLLLTLVQAGNHNDRTLFRRTVEALVAEERAKQHHVLADRLAEQLRSSGNGTVPGPESLDERTASLLLEISPRRSLDHLVLPDVVRVACAELIEEQHRAELLRSHGIEPRHRVMLIGPPGNGKTAVAEALATGLMVPLLVTRYEGVIGAYLGETAVRLRRLLEYVRQRRCVLFFDEFDTIGKERGDEHETGEIKRVVSSLLLQVDALPSYVVVVTATNHPELLDRAVWRRFQLRLHLPPPGTRELAEWFCRFEARSGLRLPYRPDDLARRLSGVSFAEVEEFAADVQRRYVLALPDADLERITDERLAQWRERLASGVSRRG